MDISDSYPIESLNHFGQIQANVGSKKVVSTPWSTERNNNMFFSGQIIATGLLQIVVRRKGIPPKMPLNFWTRNGSCVLRTGSRAWITSSFFRTGENIPVMSSEVGWMGFSTEFCGWRCPGMFVCKLDLDLLKDIENKLVSSGVNYKKLTLFGWGSVWSTDFFPELGVFEVHLQNWVPSRELCSLKRHRKFWWWFLLPKASKNK